MKETVNFNEYKLKVVQYIAEKYNILFSNINEEYIQFDIFFENAYQHAANNFLEDIKYVHDTI